MASESDDADVSDYQSEVLAALDRQRVRDLEDMSTAIEVAEGSKAGTVWNMRKHRHESRFKRFYEDAQAPTKVALTDSEGNDLQTVGTAQLIALLAKTNEAE